MSNLENLPGESLELGRSCVASEYRSFTVINLLWNAITQYAVERQIKYLFGCCSLHCSTVEQTQPIFSYLRERYDAPEPYRVHPRHSFRLPVREVGTDGIDEQKISRGLPPLLKGYLRAGAMICSAPAFDPEFGTADVFALLEMEKLATRYKQRYCADDQEVLRAGLKWNKV